MSIAKNLGKALGGRWRYDGCASWWCDDGKRHVARMHCGAYDMNGEAIDGPPHYWLYGHGPHPERAERYMRKPAPCLIPQGVAAPQARPIRGASLDGRPVARHRGRGRHPPPRRDSRSADAHPQPLKSVPLSHRGCARHHFTTSASRAHDGDRRGLTEWLRLTPPVPGQCYGGLLTSRRLPPCDGPGEVWLPDEIHPFAAVCAECARRLTEDEA